MIKTTKKEVINNIKNNITNETNTTKKKQLKRLAWLINKCNLNNYIVRVSDKGNYNIGDIVECITLHFAELEKETLNFEIKSLVINYPNVLSNEEVKTVYIVVLTQDRKKDKLDNGVYKIDANQVLNKTITKGLFNSLNGLEKVCNLTTLATKKLRELT